MKNSTGYSKRRLGVVLIILIIMIITGSISWGGLRGPTEARLSVSPVAKVKVSESYGKLPLIFEANQGQTHDQVKFLSRGRGYTLFLTPGEAVIVFSKSLQKDKVGKNSEVEATIIRMKLVGANPDAGIRGVGELPGKSNYFIGSDPGKWRTKVPHYLKVQYQEIYPGIELVFYGNQRQLEYDFIVAPGADPNAIQLAFEGAEKLEVNIQGDLILYAGVGELRLHRPRVYQAINGVRQEIPAGYVLNPEPDVQNPTSQSVSFQIAAYDASRPIIIDPVLSYSTYLGGTGPDTGNSIAVDSAGYAYVTGITSSTDFPTSGGLQPFFGGFADVFVTKLNPTGSALVYSTYLGGSDVDQGVGIAVDSSGNAYVTGETLSPNFPTTPGAFQTAGAYAAFVTKLNATGSALAYSTYLGGSVQDQGRTIAVDSFGNAYVAGMTQSTDFPTTAGAFQTWFASGSSHGFVAKLNASGSNLVYSSFLVGSNLSEEKVFGIAVDSSGNAYVTGMTSSTDFPTTMGAFQPTFGGGSSKAFVAKMNSTGSDLVYSTYLGGSGGEEGRGIAVDSSGNAYVTGTTASTDFPTVNPLQPSLGGPNDAFVAKLNPEGSALIYSTYLGGSSAEQGSGIAVDSSGNAYVTGQTFSTDFPRVSPLQAGCNASVFVAKLNPTGSAFVYSTCLGSSGSINTGMAIAVDASESAYVTGSTTPASSADFPTTVGAFQPAFGGGYDDAFVAKIATANQPPIANAGPDQTVNEGSPVTLNGTASSDPDGDSLSFSWTQTAGPTVTLSNPASLTPTFTALQVTSNTVLTFQLVVNDGIVNSSPDLVNITVLDVPAPPGGCNVDFTGTISKLTRKTYKGQDTLSFTLAIFNNGTVQSKGSFKVKFYLSTNPTLDGSDTLVFTKTLKDGDDSAARIKPGNSISVSGSAKVPSPTQGKYLIAHIDSDNNICESNETNNIAVRQIP